MNPGPSCAIAFTRTFGANDSEIVSAEALGEAPGHAAANATSTAAATSAVSR